MTVDGVASLRHGSFRRFWCAATISSFGTAVTAVAIPVLVVHDLKAGPLEVGLVNAAQLLPYALFGLVAGVYVDRLPRKTVLAWSSIGRAVALGVIPILWGLGALQAWSVAAALFAFGAFSVFGFAAAQSLLPALVSGPDIVGANARLDQADAAAQTLGPALGGGLVGLIGAPVAVLADALTYLLDATLIAGLKVDETPEVRSSSPNVRGDVGEGLTWIYGHPKLGPLAVSTHVWFLANSASLTALAVIALRTLSLSPLTYSLLLTTLGLTGLLGATLAPALGRRLGTRRIIVISRAAYPVAWLSIALALTSPAHTAVLFAGLALHGLAAGVENANEMGYWQSATPNHLLGRVNATRRSVNRSAAVLGSLLAGAGLALAGNRATLITLAVVFAAAALIAASSLPKQEPHL